MSFPSPINIISLTCLHGWLIISLNMCKSEPSYNHKLALSRPIFSNNLDHMISHELLWSIRIGETSNCLIVVVITMEKILFGVPPTFFESQNPSIDQLFLNIQHLRPFSTPFTSMATCVNQSMLDCMLFFFA